MQHTPWRQDYFTRKILSQKDPERDQGKLYRIHAVKIDPVRIDFLNEVLNIFPGEKRRARIPYPDMWFSCRPLVDCNIFVGPLITKVPVRAKYIEGIFVPQEIYEVLYGLDGSSAFESGLIPICKQQYFFVIFH